MAAAAQEQKGLGQVDRPGVHGVGRLSCRATSRRNLVAWTSLARTGRLSGPDRLLAQSRASRPRWTAPYSWGSPSVASGVRAPGKAAEGGGL